MIAHWIPFNAFQTIETHEFNENNKLPLLCAYQYNYRRHNIDGLTIYDLYNNHTNCYTQLFRNGIIESVNFYITNEEFSKIKFPLESYTKEIYNSFKSFHEYIQKSNISFPILFLISIINSKDIFINYQGARDDFNYFDRNEIHLSEIIIENREIENYDVKIKPLLDSLWNACGFNRCLMYKDDKLF